MHPSPCDLIWSYSGVLRSAGRALEAGKVLLPPEPLASASAEAKAEALAVLHSHPTWMVHRWLATFGQGATKELLEANNR